MPNIVEGEPGKFPGFSPARLLQGFGGWLDRRRGGRDKPLPPEPKGPDEEEPASET